jgi:hypothetical protein
MNIKKENGNSHDIRVTRIVHNITPQGVLIEEARITNGDIFQKWVEQVLINEGGLNLISPSTNTYRKYKVNLNNDDLITTYTFSDDSHVTIYPEGNIFCENVSPYEIFICVDNWNKKSHIREKIKQSKEPKIQNPMDDRLKPLLGKKVSLINSRKKYTIKYCPGVTERNVISVELKVISGKTRLKFQSLIPLDESELNKIVHQYFPQDIGDKVASFTPGEVATYIFTL